MTLERRLKKVANNFERYQIEREEVIREAVAAGMSYRRIGELLKITHTTVANILTRAG